MSDQLIDVRTLLAASVRFASAHDLSAGRNVDEVLRVLDAPQTGSITARNWKRGDAPLSPR